MTQSDDEIRWTRRIGYATGNIICYVESTDKVVCKLHHSDTGYSLVECGGRFHRVCNICLPQYLPRLEEPPKLSQNGPFVCKHPGCSNDAHPTNLCALCKEMYCLVHMVEDVACVTCNAETDFDYGQMCGA